MVRRLLAFLAPLALLMTALTPSPSWAEIPEPTSRFSCSTQTTTEEPLKPGTCDRYTFAISSYEFKSCSYRSYGVDIATSSDGLFRLNIRSANASGFQTSKTLEIDVHLQENCGSSYDKSAYVVGGLVSGTKGFQSSLTNPTVTHNWRASNIARLPNYCGFRSCADSKHSFKVELPEDTDFYTITLFFADAKTGLTNGLKNSTAIFRNMILRSTATFDASSIPFSLQWRKTENGYMCEITSTLSRQDLWNKGVREIRLLGTAGPSESIQTKGPNLGISLTDPATSKAKPTGIIPHGLGLFKYDFTGPSSIANEYFDMSSLLVYVCKAWLTTISGPSEVVKSSIVPTESFANPIPGVPVEREIPESWVEVAWISAFSSSTKKLNSKQNSEIQSFLRSLPESGQVTCSAYFSNPNTRSRSNLALSRAKAVCDYAKRLRPLNAYSFRANFTGNKQLNGQVFLSAKK
jgi:hypothetical protein